MSTHFKESDTSSKKFEPNYHLTMYRLEGHKTWRSHISLSSKGFAVEQKNWTTSAPKIIEKKLILIDRITGVLLEKK